MEVPFVTPDRIVKLGLAFRGAKTLLSAAELGVFTALAEGPLDLDTLSKQVGIHERGARDFFDALVALLAPLGETVGLSRARTSGESPDSTQAGRGPIEFAMVSQRA
jgi:hypothetical protein